MPGRTIAIGDIHGCSTALAALLDAIQPAPEDMLIALGDSIDRGPDSRGAINQLIALSNRCRLVHLLGNHEEMLLRSRFDSTWLKEWLSCGGVEMLASYGYIKTPGDRPRSLLDLLPPEHWAFFAACRDYHETQAHIFVHAGYAANLPMDQQPGEAMRWQFTDAAKARPHFSGKTAIVGHTPQRSGAVLDLAFLKCIDTHCHAGKWLTALEVNTGQVWQTNQRGKLRGEARGET